jgi:hypothetical protein
MAGGLVHARSGREPFDDADDIACCDARFAACVGALLAKQAVDAQLRQAIANYREVRKLLREWEEQRLIDAAEPKPAAKT